MSNEQSVRVSSEHGDDTLQLLAEALAEASGALARDPVAVGQHIRRARDLLASAVDETVKPATRQEVQKGGLAPWQKSRIDSHIRANIATKFDMAELGQLVRLSSSHFARAFKASFGLSPHAYIMAQRVLEAKRLMLATDMALAEVAAACGMGDQAHLCHLFRRRVGMSPANWRRTNRRVPGASPMPYTQRDKLDLRPAL
jgi:transcriptional regulator GlxA family with amidase domain